MRVAIAGAGNVGVFIANDLVAAGHEVQLIEQNPLVVERAGQLAADPTASDDHDVHDPSPVPSSDRGCYGVYGR